MRRAIVLAAILLAAPVGAECAGDHDGNGRLDVADAVWLVSQILDGAPCVGPSETATDAPTETPTPAATPTDTATPSPSVTDDPTRTPTPTPSATEPAPPTPSIEAPTETPSPTATPADTPTLTVPPPARTLGPADQCWSVRENGGFATRLGDCARRVVSEYSICFNGRTFEHIDSPVCDLTMGFDDPNPSVPTSCVALRTVNSIDTDDEIRRVEYHCQEDKVSQCPNAEWALMWDAVRYRAAVLGHVVPPAVEIQYHAWPVSNPSPVVLPWDVFNEMIEIHYVYPWMLQMRADIAASPMAASPRCSGFAMNRFGDAIANAWLATGLTSKCEDFYDAVGAFDDCVGVLPTRAWWNARCGEYRARLLPLYQGFRAAQGKAF